MLILKIERSAAIHCQYMARDERSITNKKLDCFCDIFCFTYTFKQGLIDDTLPINFIKLWVAFRPLHRARCNRINAYFWAEFMSERFRKGD